MKNINWAIYARKSLEDSSKQVQSIDDQIKIQQDIAKRLGLNVVEIIYESKSAKAPYARDGFTRLCNLVSDGKINGILAWKMDRLFRNAVDGGFIQYALQEKKILCIKTPEKDYLPEDNAIIMSVESGMSSQYIRDLSVNVKRGMNSKADKGWFPSSAPIGYLNSKLRDKGNETILVDEKNFPIVRKMWDLMLTGNYTIPKIHVIASKEWGLRTIQRKTLGGKELSLSFMYKLFTNIFYTGNFMFGDKLFVGKHKPMITMEEFDRVQAMLGKKGNPRPRTLAFPFTGLLTCDECGAQITATEKHRFVKKSNKVHTYVYYHCTGKKKIIKCTAKKYVKTEEVEKQVSELLSKNTIHQEFYELGLSVLKDIHGNEVNDREIIYQKHLDTRNQIQKKLDNSLQYLLNDTISGDVYRKNKIELELELQKQDIKIREIENHTKNFNDLTEKAFHFMRHAKEAFQNGDLQTKKEIMSALGLNKRLNREKLFVDMHSWMNVLKAGEKNLLPRLMKSELKNIHIPQGQKFYSRELFTSGCSLVYQLRTSNSTYSSKRHFECLIDEIEKEDV